MHKHYAFALAAFVADDRPRRAKNAACCHRDYARHILHGTRRRVRRHRSHVGEAVRPRAGYAARSARQHAGLMRERIRAGLVGPVLTEHLAHDVPARSLSADRRISCLLESGDITAKAVARNAPALEEPFKVAPILRRNWAKFYFINHGNAPRWPELDRFPNWNGCGRAQLSEFADEKKLPL